jgi:hypothetical protein
MIVHGFSHAAASLVGAVVVNAISYRIDDFLHLSSISLAPAVPFFSKVALEVSERQLTEVMILVTLAFVWGVCFRIIRGRC